MTYNVFSGTLNPTHFTVLNHMITCNNVQVTKHITQATAF